MVLNSVSHRGLMRAKNIANNAERSNVIRSRRMIHSMSAKGSGKVEIRSTKSDLSLGRINIVDIKHYSYFDRDGKEDFQVLRERPANCM